MYPPSGSIYLYRRLLIDGFWWFALFNSPNHQSRVLLVLGADRVFRKKHNATFGAASFSSHWWLLVVVRDGFQCTLPSGSIYLYRRLLIDGFWCLVLFNSPNHQSRVLLVLGGDRVFGKKTQYDFWWASG